MLKVIRQLSRNSPNVVQLQVQGTQCRNGSSSTITEYDKDQERKPEQGINKVQLMGRIGRDPQQLKGRNDTEFVSFSVATSQSFRKTNSDNIMQTKTDWHNIVVFGRGMEYVMSNLKKGDRVMIDGKLSYSVQVGDQYTERTNILSEHIRLITRGKRDPQAQDNQLHNQDRRDSSYSRNREDDEF